MTGMNGVVRLWVGNNVNGFLGGRGDTKQGARVVLWGMTAELTGMAYLCDSVSKSPCIGKSISQLTN